MTPALLKFKSASPFPHTVIDDFLPPAVVQAMVEEVADLPREAWKWKTAGDGATVSKGSINLFADLPQTVQNTVLEMYGAKFLKWLEERTGIQGLISDPSLLQSPRLLEGGGLHRIEPGGRLGVHVDFNSLEKMPTYRRRLNLLLYLNPGWKDEWGGDLELWDASHCCQRIPPLMNRCVIFETSAHSWHGHPKPLACPKGRYRLSMALYFYSHEQEAVLHRTTQYR